jgi:hypothetical protein
MFYLRVPNGSWSWSPPGCFAYTGQNVIPMNVLLAADVAFANDSGIKYIKNRYFNAIPDEEVMWIMLYSKLVK